MQVGQAFEVLGHFDKWGELADVVVAHDKLGQGVAAVGCLVHHAHALFDFGKVLEICGGHVHVARHVHGKVV
ncbi:hypothetical protein HYQ46_000394 [Verticillium longisporum]|nr:hypothetical protein HYQ46_000394 [Verticillium longisporum]